MPEVTKAINLMQGTAYKINKFVLGVCIIGFGLLLLMSPEKHSWIFSALAVGIGSGIILKRREKHDKDDK